jgi:hypothetical protein
LLSEEVHNLMWFEDKAWRSAAQWVIRLAGRCDYVLAPQPLQGLAPRCLPLEFAYCIPHELSCAIIVPKDEVDRLSLVWLRRLKSFQLIFVDDVFAVFSTVSLDDLPDPEQKAIVQETPYLWNRVDAVLAGLPIRKNFVDSSLTTAEPGDPYCLIVNACLTGNAGDKTMAAAAGELLARARPDLRCVVADPDVDRSLIAGASLVVLGPGGMLYDLIDHAELAIDFQNIANYFRLGYIARDYRRPFCVLGFAQQSKIVSRTTLDFVGGAISDAMFVTTRDSESAKLFIGGLNFHHPLLVTPDVSVIFSKEIRDISCEPTARRCVAICGSFGARIILDAMRGFADEVRFVLQAEEDAAWFTQHEKQLRAEIPGMTVVDVRTSEPKSFFRAVASADTVITTRFHTMMIGIMAGIDTVVLGVANDKRHRVCAALAEERWIKFVHSDVTSADSLQSIISNAVQAGQRQPSRGIFNHTRVDEICRLLQLAAMQALPVATAAFAHPNDADINHGDDLDVLTA